MSNVAVVLVEPREPGNIGATARAMANMGLSRLILVRPVEYLVPEAFKMALGGKGIIEGAAVFDELAEALAGFGFVAGTTCRNGAERRGCVSPRALAEELVRICPCNQTAILFGREDRGLTNRELKLCHRLVTIPAVPSYSSLNLAQSVLLVVYELYLASKGGALESATHSDIQFATVERVEELYSHMERVLLEIGYLHHNNPQRMMRAFRRLFGRAGLEDRDVRALRGIFRQVEWYAFRRERSRV